MAGTAPSAPERISTAASTARITFAGRELDLSADEDYAPPAQTGEPIYHWTAGEEGLSEAPEEKPNLLQRIISFGSSLRRDSKRPLRSSGKDAAEDIGGESYKRLDGVWYNENGTLPPEDAVAA